MAFEDVTYEAVVTRTQKISVTVTDGTEEVVWRAIDEGWLAPDMTRDAYDALSEKAKAEFLANCVISGDLSDFYEETGGTYRVDVNRKG